jgi:MFS family permease
VKKAKLSQSNSLWHNRNYLLLWSGQTISSVGSGVSQIAFPLLVLMLTHSPAQAGLAGALRAAPYFIFTLPGGALIDRWNRKWVMILCNAGRALSLGSIPVAFVLGHLTIVQLYIVALLEGTLYVFFDLAETASLPRVVSREQLPAATAQNNVTFGITTLLGPPLGTVLYSIGRFLPFLADAVSYAISVLSLFLMRAKFQEERIAPRRKLYLEVSEGIKWLWHQPLLRSMALLNCVMAGLGSGGTLLIIVLAQRQHTSTAFIGFIFSLGGIGAILGSLLARPVQQRFSYGQAIIAILWLYPLPYVLLAVAPTPLILGGLLAAGLLVDATYNVVQFSYRLALIPDELQGRVNSSFRLISYSLRPLGQVLTGVLLQDIGPIFTILAFSLCLVVLAVAASLNPHVRNAR